MTDRKARLAALAAKAGRAKETPSGEDENTAADSTEVSDKGATTTPTVTFRNYTPVHGSLNEKNAQDEEPSSKRARQEEPAVSALEQALAKAKAEAAVSATGSSTSALQHTGNLGVVAPKKANWDLKRDIKPKLDKLEKRTQKATVQLLKERLQQEATAADDVD
jgi:coiled-coil domain-containing protein 12